MSGVVGEVSKEIDGITYTVRLFPATEGMELGRRIARLISRDAIAAALLLAVDETEDSVLEGLKTEVAAEKDEQTPEPPTEEEAEEQNEGAGNEPSQKAPSLGKLMRNPQLIASFVLGAAEQTQPGEISALAKALLKYCTADKVRIGKAENPGSVHKNFDTHFAGRYMHMLKVCVFAARAGFGGPSLDEP
jgi:hypothetical protein